MDKYVSKARFMLFGIDDELKTESSSIYSTTINSSYYPVPAATAVPYIIENTSYNIEAVNFTTRKNTKKYRFTLNNSFKNLKLTTKARLVIESIFIPNVISKSFLQAKAINNVVVKLSNIPNSMIYDSMTKGKSGSVIFSAPFKQNTQGNGVSYDANSDPDRLGVDEKPRVQFDNNGILYTNPNPLYLYNFAISDDWLKNGIFEFDIIYDIGNCLKQTATLDEYTFVPQTLVYDHDKDVLEGFQISFIILDYPDEETIYNEKELLNSINKLILKKP
jgi:hypothetical protein